MKKLAEMTKMIKSGELKEKLLTGEDLQKKYAKWILAFYTIIVLWIIVFKCNVNDSLHIQENLEKTLWERFTYRLIPFTDLAYLIRSRTFDLEGLAFLFNIISFMPLGMFLMLFMNKKKSVITLFLFSLGVEIFQLFTGFGGFDPTDLLLNTSGAFFGCLLFKPVYKQFTERALNASLLVTATLLGIWAAFAVVRTIVMFPL